jgi:hypothetical protein
MVIFAVKSVALSCEGEYMWIRSSRVVVVVVESKQAHEGTFWKTSQWRTPANTALNINYKQGQSSNLSGNSKIMSTTMDEYSLSVRFDIPYSMILLLARSDHQIDEMTQHPSCGFCALAPSLTLHPLRHQFGTRDWPCIHIPASDGQSSLPLEMGWAPPGDISVRA